MEDLNDIIASLSADDINMLKGVASSILGDSNEDDNAQSNSNNSNNSNHNQSNNNFRSNNHGNVNNNAQFNNNSQSNNSLQNTINSLLNNNQNNNQNNSQNQNRNQNNNQSLNGLNLNSLGINADDFKMMMKAKTIFDKMNNTSDKNTDLILALKPHLSPENRNKADIAIKILRLFDILPMLKDLF